MHLALGKVARNEELCLMKGDTLHRLLDTPDDSEPSLFTP